MPTSIQPVTRAPKKTDQGKIMDGSYEYFVGRQYIGSTRYVDKDGAQFWSAEFRPTGTWFKMDEIIQVDRFIQELWDRFLEKIMKPYNGREE